MALGHGLALVDCQTSDLELLPSSNRHVWADLLEVIQLAYTIDLLPHTTFTYVA